MLFALALVAAQASPAPETEPPPADETVTVTARRKRLNTILGTVLQSSENSQLARYEVPVCPGISGAPASAAPTLLRLVRENGERAGVRLAKPGCKTNALIMFSNEPDAVVTRMRQKWPSYFGQVDMINRQRLASAGAPIRSWHAVEAIGAAGEALDEGGAPGTGARVARFARASRLVESTLQSMAMGFVIVDSNAVGGKTLQQLADVTSMHLYLDLSRNAAIRVESGSILTLFEPRGADVAVPPGMNAFDRGVLAGAYKGENRYKISYQRGRIARSIADAQAAENSAAD